MPLLSIREVGEEADALIACLRERLANFGVAVDDQRDPDGTVMVVVTQPQRIDDVPALLRNELDECGRSLGTDWGEYLTVGGE